MLVRGKQATSTRITVYWSYGTNQESRVPNCKLSMGKAEQEPMHWIEASVLEPIWRNRDLVWQSRLYYSHNTKTYGDFQIRRLKPNWLRKPLQRPR